MNYSGQPLSTVPYEDIATGMKVISHIGNPGKVIKKVTKEESPNRENDNYLEVQWVHGKTSINFHFLFTFVKVK